SGELAVGVVPPRLSKPGMTLNWVYRNRLHSVQIEHVSFCLHSHRQIVISADSQRILSVCDPGVRDVLQVLLPRRVLAMTETDTGIASILEGITEIVRWKVDSLAP